MGGGRVGAAKIGAGLLLCAGCAADPGGRPTTEGVIAPDRKTACVDAPVPHFKAMRPIHTVVRDIVFLLDRRLNEAEDGLESWVRMYSIDTSECTWLELN